MGTVIYPTAGYIADFSAGALPGGLRSCERTYLRDLARKVAEIAAEPGQEEKRNLWYRHNNLEKVRPMLLVFPEDSWVEIIGEDKLSVEDPFWRQWEWYLKHLIYRHDNLPDDFVIEPQLLVNRAIKMENGWGVTPKWVHSKMEKGSYVYDPPLKNPEDIDKVTYPRMKVDEETTNTAFEAVSSVFGDILPVEIHCSTPYNHVNLISAATMLRGIQQLMLDMYDRPEWVHRLMRLLADGEERNIRYLEENNYLSLNNGHHYTDSGGIGYSKELPSADYDGTNTCLKDLWGFGVAQEMSEVSPMQHEEFLLQYQMRVLKDFGLVSYGCCEPYTTKFDMVKQIPQLRRVSISPWCNVEAAANSLEDKYIFSWKPNPAMLVHGFDPEEVRKYIRHTLEVAKDCVVEVVLKDTFTIEHDPNRVRTWTRIAREEIQRVE